MRPPGVTLFPYSANGHDEFDGKGGEDNSDVMVMSTVMAVTMVVLIRVTIAVVKRHHPKQLGEESVYLAHIP